MDRLLKAEGSGNDFIIGLGRWARRLREDVALVQRLCDRRRGIGADGVLALEPGAGGRLDVVYRNADGSQAAFCGNATRCAARVGAELLGLGPALEIVTDWAVIPAEVRAEGVALRLPCPEEAPHPVQLEVDGEIWHLQLCTLGVPHAVADAGDRLEALDLARVGPRLGHHPLLEPEGRNIDLVQRLPGCSTTAPGADRLQIRTWERGVEAETLSCGSGVVVAALLHLAASGSSRVECRTAGGDSLLLEALGRPPACPSLLIGPTRVIASLDPHEDLLLEHRDPDQDL